MLKTDHHPQLWASPTGAFWALLGTSTVVAGEGASHLHLIWSTKRVGFRESRVPVPCALVRALHWPLQLLCTWGDSGQDRSF